jgi:hypothetical protein
LLAGGVEGDRVWDSAVAGDLKRGDNIMGVGGYFPGGLPDLRQELRDAVTDVTRKGGAALEPLSLVENLAELKERYDFVEDYDPVLRAHCKLDKAG